ncbi:DEAD/DEAH box helicase [Paenibacillus antri]|uniref:DNA 3'-5' helicase n=1 Tax=Paenibacillus antri TaxID=2582848 RepID=A0A5R9G977_9BACL|nr:DNA repair helicase XPB [Paenibacillus antri]TLS49938.1 DEAD/DEAH box helicase [Paenibacillus antri]
MKDKPIIVQSDFTVLLETRHPKADEVRPKLSSFADLRKSPDGLHTYRITPLSLWNAASAGATAESIVETLTAYAKFGVPAAVVKDIRAYVNRYGLVRIEREGKQLMLRCDDPEVLKAISAYDSLRSYWEPSPMDHRHTIAVRLTERGSVKQELMRLGYPVVDVAGYQDGEPVPIALRPSLRASGKPFGLRDYQEEAVEAFYRGGAAAGGSGVLVLPCGAGKTVIGIGAMAKLGRATLILTTNSTSVKQWRQELLDKTTLTEDDIGEYGADRKEVRPITIATYQMLTHRKSKDGEFSHMKLFGERSWGLIVYDEVHLLPAPVFRATADIQATRRLGLTATLVREDGREEDVFSLVGPKRYEVPWKRLEAQGWIATVDCTEVRVPMSGETLEAYRKSGAREQHRIAGENPAKLDVARQLLDEHRGNPTLVIGQYLDQLGALSEELGCPVVTGETPNAERERLYAAFRKGEIGVLIVSKVANFAVDLPDAAVAIQVSGSFGSRQEEAQRLGRVLRPKEGNNEAHFYALVSEGTKELEFAMKRQMFLVEQGYRYRSVGWDERRADGLSATPEEGEQAG